MLIKNKKFIKFLFIALLVILDFKLVIMDVSEFNYYVLWNFFFIYLPVKILYIFFACINIIFIIIFLIEILLFTIFFEFILNLIQIYVNFVSNKLIQFSDYL